MSWKSKAMRDFAYLRAVTMLAGALVGSPAMEAIINYVGLVLLRYPPDKRYGLPMERWLELSDMHNKIMLRKIA